MYAAHYGHYNVIKMLIDNGANVNAQEWVQGRTALMLASSCGHTRCLEALVTLGGADINIKDYNGRTASYYAIHSGHGRNKIISKVLKIQPKSKIISRPITKLKHNEIVPVVTITKPKSDSNDNSAKSSKLTEPFTPYMHFPISGSENETLSSSPVVSNVSSPNKQKDSAQNFTPHFHVNISRGGKRRLHLYNNYENGNSIPSKTFRMSEDSNSKDLSKDPLPKNLDQLLTRLDLMEYRELFTKNGIDLYCFLTLSESDFENLGIYAIGHRRKLSLAQTRFREFVEISDTQERFFADWLLYERENLKKENEELKLKIKQLEALWDTIGPHI